MQAYLITILLKGENGMTQQKSEDHNGTCGFCGSSVRKGFPTCAACGATWRAEGTPAGLGVLAVSVIIGILAAIGVLVNAVSSQALSGWTFIWAFLAFFLILGCGSSLGQGMRAYAWYRPTLTLR
jgi:uncharacterized protein (DUF983 family)